MKTLCLFAFAAILSGCATCDTKPPTPETITVKQVEYVVKIPPKNLLELPAQVKPVEVDKAKQSDIARWILANEERTRLLENMIQEIAVFFKTEQENLKRIAEEKNKKELEAASEQQGKSAQDAIDKPLKK